MSSRATSHSDLRIAAEKARHRLDPLLWRESREQCRGMEWRPLPPKGEWAFEATGADGGSARIEGETSTFYAVKAWAGRIRPRGKRRLDREARAAHVGVVAPPRYIEERIGLYRETLEALVALEALPGGGGLLLLDGSLKPVARPGRLGGLGRPSDESIAEIAHRIGVLVERGDIDLVERLEALGGHCPKHAWRCIQEYLEDPGVPRPASAELVLRTLGGRMDWAPVLETLEKLWAYKRLLEEAWRRRVNVVFLTKTSRQDSMCGGPYSDIHYIRRRWPTQPGYAVWEGSLHTGVLEVTGLDESSIGPYYVEALGLREFYFERLGLVEFYTRLSPGGPVLVVDSVVDARRLPGGGGVTMDFLVEHVEGLLERLLALPGAEVGYPSILFTAHQFASIKGGERAVVEGIIGLARELPSRSMLAP